MMLHAARWARGLTGTGDRQAGTEGLPIRVAGDPGQLCRRRSRIDAVRRAPRKFSRH